MSPSRQVTAMMVKCVGSFFLLAVVTTAATLAAGPAALAAEQTNPAGVQAQPVKIRPSALAGTWYPASREGLRKIVSGLLDRAEPPKVDGSRVAGLIAPHAGYQYSGAAAATAFKLLKKGGAKTVVLMGPSHHAAFAACLVAEVDAYQTPLGDVPLDKDVCKKLLAKPLFASDEIVHRQEHSLEIELPFLQTQLGDFKLIPILVGVLNPGEYDGVARSLRECVPADALYVVSSDFTHYGASYDYVPFKENIKENLNKLDGEAIRLISAKDFDGFERYLGRTRSTICGRAPIGILLKLLPADTKGTLLKYYTSGDLTQDWSTSVSYAAIAFTGGRSSEDLLTEDEQRTLSRIARDTLVSHVTGGKVPDAEKYDLTPALRRDGAAFVTLTINGELRGCIGSLTAVEPLYRCVMRRAADSSEDPRFPLRVQSAELPRIGIQISVLSAPVKADSLEDVVIRKHGLIIEKNGRRAVFLPQVAAEQGWNREQMAENLCLKADLPADAWKNGATFRIFTSQDFNEAELAAPARRDWTAW